MGRRARPSWAESCTASRCSPRPSALPASVSPRPPGPLSAQRSPVTLSSAISPLEHCFTPFRHLLCASLSTRRRRLLLFLSGSQTPLVLFPNTLTQDPLSFPDLTSQSCWQRSPQFPPPSPSCLSLPVRTSLLLHPQLRPSVLHSLSCSLITHRPTFSRNVFSPRPLLPVPQSSYFCPSQCRQRKQGKCQDSGF